MSRIHEALERARREGATPVLGPRPVAPRASDEREATLGRKAPGPSPLRRLSEREVRPIAFTPKGLAALARSYEPIERLFGLYRGPMLGIEGDPLRTLVVARPASDAAAAVAALAMAATLAEKSKSRVVLVDGDRAQQGLSELCAVERGSSGLWDLGLGEGEPERCVRRTALGGLYFVPPGNPISRDGDPEAALEQAFRFLRDCFDFVVVHAGAVFEDAWASLLIRQADALLLVASDPDAALRDARGRLPARDVPLRVIEELR